MVSPRPDSVHRSFAIAWLAGVTCACHGRPRRELVFDLETSAPGCVADVRALERGAAVLEDRFSEKWAGPNPAVFVHDGTVIASVPAELDDATISELADLAHRRAVLAIDRFADDPGASTTPVADHVARLRSGETRSLTTTGVTGSAIDRARVTYTAPNSPAVEIELTPDGRHSLEALGGQHVAFVLGGIIREQLVVPRSLDRPLAIIASGMTIDERERNAADLAAVLNAGAATCPLVLRRGPAR